MEPGRRRRWRGRREGRRPAGAVAEDAGRSRRASWPMGFAAGSGLRTRPPQAAHSSFSPSTTMDTPSTSAAALKLEIERLTGTPSLNHLKFPSDTCVGVINQRKTGGPPTRTTYPAASTYPRYNVYVNPNYKPPSRTFRPPVPAVVPNPKPISKPPVSTTQETRDVIIGGVAFESSGRSLVRKDSAYSFYYSTMCDDFVSQIGLSSIRRWRRCRAREGRLRRLTWI